MRLRATLTTLAVTTAITVLAPMAPALALPPKVSGSFATVTPALAQPMRAKDCADVATVTTTIDLAGIGADLEGRLWYTPNGDPVRTTLVGETTSRVTGPDNFYEEFGHNLYYPTNVGTEDLTVCPDDFGSGRVAPGVYSIQTTVTVDNRFTSFICHRDEPCDDFSDIYVTTVTSTFTLAPSATCTAAKKAAAALAKKLKQAKKAHQPTQVRKLKKKLATKRAVVERAC